MNIGPLCMISLADELEQFVLGTVPKSKTVQKYGGTLFTLKPEEKEGQFCGIFIQQKHVHLSFSKGAQLKDPKGLLHGSGKLRRYINIASSEEVDFRELGRLLERASVLSLV